jgi:Flp pilus assembly protein TadG
MTYSPLHQNKRRGSASVEFAVIMAFLIPVLLTGLWEVGRMVEVTQVLSNAAREGARQSASGEWSDVQVASNVKLYLQQEGLPTQNVQVAVVNQGFPGNPNPANNNPQNATDLDRLQVTVTIPWQDVQWINLSLVTNSATLLSGNANWASVKDRAYPAPTPPAGY